MKPAIAICLLMAATAQAQHAAHEHGAARLTLVQDGKDVSLELETPLDNVAGFEHAPRSEADRAALAKAEAALRELTRVVVLPAAAGCVAADIDVGAHFGAGADEGNEPEHEGGHADMDARYRFTCAKPEALDVIDVTLFDTFPRLQRIDAEAATGRGQGAATLTRQAPEWRLPGH